MNHTIADIQCRRLFIKRTVENHTLQALIIHKIAPRGQQRGDEPVICSLLNKLLFELCVSL